MCNEGELEEKVERFCKRIREDRRSHNDPHIAYCAENIIPRERNPVRVYSLTVNFSLKLHEREINGLPEYREFEDKNKLISRMHCIKSELCSCKFKPVLYKYLSEQWHFSLLNVRSIPGENIESIREPMSPLITEIKKILREHTKDCPPDGCKVYIDFLYYNKYSVALQVFLKNDFISLLKNIGNHLNELKRQMPCLENELKLYPCLEQPDRAAMNLFRYDNLDKQQDREQLKEFFEGIDTYNERAYKVFHAKHEIETTRINGLFLVYSDPYFDDREIVDFYPFGRTIQI